jgi:hypothetical protein
LRKGKEEKERGKKKEETPKGTPDWEARPNKKKKKKQKTNYFNTPNRIFPPLEFTNAFACVFTCLLICCAGIWERFNDLNSVSASSSNPIVSPLRRARISSSMPCALRCRIRADFSDPPAAAAAHLVAQAAWRRRKETK